jgi:Flp pilus assembly protein TadD
LGDSPLEINPTDPVAYMDGGETWFNQQQFDRAISEFNQLLEIDSTNAEPYFHRGGVYDMALSPPNGGA